MPFYLYLGLQLISLSGRALKNAPNPQNKNSASGVDKLLLTDIIILDII